MRTDCILFRFWVLRPVPKATPAWHLCLLAPGWPAICVFGLSPADKPLSGLSLQCSHLRVCLPLRLMHISLLMEAQRGRAAVVSHFALRTSEASIKLLGQKCLRACSLQPSTLPPKGLVYMESGGKLREPKKVKFEKLDTADLIGSHKKHRVAPSTLLLKPGCHQNWEKQRVINWWLE